MEYSAPAVVNGVAYVGSQDRAFYALNASTGSKIWSFAAGNSIKSVAAVVNNVLYFGSLDNNIYALNVKTGSQIWNFTTGNQVYSSPNVVDGVVYIGSNDNYVYAIGAIAAQQQSSPSFAASPSPTIPELPSWIILPPLLVITALMFAAIKKNHTLKRQS